MTLEQIKNDYAVSMTFKDWEDLLKYFINEDSKFSISTIVRHENEVMKIYAMECLKVASLNVDYEYTFLYSSERNVGDKVANQITNENNIIK